MAERTLGVVTVIEYPPSSDSYVLVEEIKQHKKGRQNLAGGGLDGKGRKEESILDAALREMQEETGLEGELTGFLGVFDYGIDGKLQLAFAARAAGGKLRSSPKHPTVESYPFGVIEGSLAPEGHLRSDRVLEVISQYRKGLILPVEAAVHISDTDTPPSRLSLPQEPAESLVV